MEDTGATRGKTDELTKSEGETQAWDEVQVERDYEQGSANEEDVKQVWEKIRQGESLGGKVNKEGAFQIIYFFFFTFSMYCSCSYKVHTVG